MLDYLKISSRDIEESITKELDDTGTNWWSEKNLEKIVVTSWWYMGSKVGQLAVDLEIRMKGHLLSRELFSGNAGTVVHSSSSIWRLAIQVLKQCYGHLLATVLIARALKEVKDICIWEYASWVLGLLPTSHTEKIEFCLINALAFVQGRLGSTNKCVK